MSYTAIALDHGGHLIGYIRRLGRNLPAALMRSWLVPLGLLIFAGNAHAAVKHYACSAARELTVERNAAAARVSLGKHTYDLTRKRSSIGDKYLSGDAALVIDGPSAVFVTGNRIDAGTCVEAVPVAASR